jgi:hypothetical protein
MNYENMGEVMQFSLVQVFFKNIYLQRKFFLGGHIGAIVGKFFDMKVENRGRRRFRMDPFIVYNLETCFAKFVQTPRAFHHWLLFL